MHPVAKKLVIAVVPFSVILVIGAALLMREADSGFTVKRVGSAFGAAVSIVVISFVIDALYPKKKASRIALWVTVAFVTGAWVLLPLTRT